jgi:ribosomal protein S18 acetylase RimI-like enzyme
MRAIDVLECSIAGHSAKQALRTGMRTSIVCWTAKIDGRPEAMFGVHTSDFLYGEGQIWLLGTDVLARNGKSLVRLGRTYTKALFDHYTLLHNRVHADNEKAIRWLARLGFVIGPVDVIRGHPMREFSACAIPSRSV